MLSYESYLVILLKILHLLVTYCYDARKLVIANQVETIGLGGEENHRYSGGVCLSLLT